MKPRVSHAKNWNKCYDARTDHGDASVKHDFAYKPKFFDGSKVGAFRHAQWGIDAWVGPGIEPGLFGQVYRAVGTPVFVGFSQVEYPVQLAKSTIR